MRRLRRRRQPASAASATASSSSVVESFESPRRSGRDSGATWRKTGTVEVVERIEIFVVEAPRQVIGDDAGSRV